MNIIRTATYLYPTASWVQVSEWEIRIGDEVVDLRQHSDYDRAVAHAAREDRLKRLEAIFNEKTTGLKKLAIDKPYMTDPETINNQYRVYEEMYKNALKGYYDDATNQAIIYANETAKQALAPITLLLNSVRSAIEAAIMADDQRADEMLDAAAAVSLAKEDLTPDKITSIKEAFWL